MRIRELFCEVDAFWQQFGQDCEQGLLANGKHSRQHADEMHPSEMMTILIHFHQSCYRTFKHSYLKYVQVALRQEFPRLLSYTRMVKVMADYLIPLTLYLFTTRSPLWALTLGLASLPSPNSRYTTLSCNSGTSRSSPISFPAVASPSLIGRNEDVDEDLTLSFLCAFTEIGFGGGDGREHILDQERFGELAHRELADEVLNFIILAEVTPRHEDQGEAGAQRWIGGQGEHQALGGALGEVKVKEDDAPLLPMLDDMQGHIEIRRGLHHIARVLKRTADDIEHIFVVFQH